MKPPTFAPAYVGLFPILAEVAQSHGYALAVHGSVSRDFDLVAVPWTDVATDAETLIRAIAASMAYTMDSALTPDMLFEPPYTERKSHGRRSWAIPLDSGAVIDISVMPRDITGKEAEVIEWCKAQSKAASEDYAESKRKHGPDSDEYWRTEGMKAAFNAVIGQIEQHCGVEVKR